MASKRSHPSSRFEKLHAKRVGELIREFAAHRDSASKSLEETHGWFLASEGGIDADRIFRIWLLQKIAGIQLVVEDIDRRLKKFGG